MSRRQPHAYDNGYGDWWVRVDQAPTEADARVILGDEPYAPVEYRGVEWVELWEGEIGERYARHAERQAHRFREVEVPSRAAESLLVTGPEPRRQPIPKPMTETGRKVVAMRGASLFDDVLGIEWETREATLDEVARAWTTHTRNPEGFSLGSFHEVLRSLRRPVR